MAKTKVTIINLTDNTDLFKKATDEAIIKALEMCGSQAEGYAAMLCPVDTGLLRNSITHTMGGNYLGKVYKDDASKQFGMYNGSTGSHNDQTVYIGTNVEYAAPVELGTSKQKAQPYLKPALLNHIREYENIIKSVLSDG